MFAKVHRLRIMGALGDRPPPNQSEWAGGVLEFSTAAGDGERRTTRRLILRHAMANPDKGVIFELFQPELVNVVHQHLQVRGIEPTTLGSGRPCAMLQEWLVLID